MARGNVSRPNAKTRYCSKCKRCKPVEKFNASAKSKHGVQMHCKDCNWARHIETRYGITKSRYAEILKAQSRRCAICLTPITQIKEKMHVDHCHSTGAVRGILCRLCNYGLGNFRDIPDLMRRAAEYVEAGTNWQDAR